MKLKPVPRFILIFAFVGVVAAGVNHWYENRPKQEVSVEQPQSVEQTQLMVQQEVPAVQAPVEPAPQVTRQDPGVDRGLDAVLKNAGAK